MFAPPSEPFADAAELGTPPARTELNEYIDDTDIRFDESKSDMEGRGRSAPSGNCGCFVSSVIFPGESLGVSKSTAISSLLDLLLVNSDPCLEYSPPDIMLYGDDVRDFGGGGGIEMLARSEFVSVVPGSAFRLLRLDKGFRLETGDKVFDRLLESDRGREVEEEEEFSRPGSAEEGSTS